MREIIFRGKRNYNEWVYGSLLKYKDGDCFMCCEDYIPGILNKYQVDLETVCQYTGLTDKNRKKIFEGDIVDYEDEAPGQYEYHDSLIINRGVIGYSEGCFYWTNAVNANLLDSVYKGVADCEVIGNIFDNPELLEGSEV